MIFLGFWLDGIKTFLPFEAVTLVGLLFLTRLL
jgi:hypothetical protein